MTTARVPGASLRAALCWLPLSTGCGEDARVVQQPTLERPVAVGFACTDGNDEIVDAVRCAPGGNGRLWALVANSTRGEVAVADVSTVDLQRRIRDLDSLSPGYQMLSVGRHIADLAVSPASIGGRPAPVVAATANAGSCDFGLIDVQDLIAGQTPVANRVSVSSASGPLRLRPHALEFVAGRASEIYATLPGCGLLARIDLESGALLQALRILPDGTARAEAAPVCPAECGDATGGCLGSACPDAALPTDFDVADDGSLLVVSAGAGMIVIVALDAGGAMGPARAVTLEGAPEPGKVKISPATGFGRFAYVAASDGSIRVVSLTEFRECETNAAPEAAALVMSGCAPLEPPGATPRRMLARGPGIDLARAGEENIVLPIDIAFSASGSRVMPSLACPGDASGDGSATFLDGVFAHVLASDGRVVTIDVQDCGYHDAVPHTIRSSFRRVGATGAFRLPAPLVGFIDENGDRVVDAPERHLGAPLAPDDRYPVLRPTTTGPEDVGVAFPDPRVTPDDNVALVFEGVLPGTGRGQGAISDCGSFVCLRDPGAQFCARGVEPGDVVEFVSCFSDSQCRDVERCYLDPQATVEQGGMCVCDEGADPDGDRCMDPNTAECRPLLRARREYTIRVARGGELELEPLVLDQAGEPRLIAACFPSPTRYQVRARNALVLNSASFAYAHRIIQDTDTDRTCIPDPSRSPLVRSKFSLAPDDCVNSAVPEPNPCATRDLVRARHPLYDLAIGRADDTPERGPDVDFTITFRVAGALSRYVRDTGTFLPAAMQLAPDGYLYVVDEGDAIGTNIRGQVRRLRPSDAEVQDESDFILF